MSITYRQDDQVSGRWTGKGGRLTNQEGDENLFDHESRISTLEGNYTLTVSLDAITQPTPSSLLFHKTDGSTQGPFEMPLASFRDRGDWEADTPYLLNDTFNAPDGGLYRVLVDHTSAGSFSPTANDGAGHDYYAAMIPPRGNTLPSGGAVGTYLRKNGSDDYNANWASVQATEVTFSPSSGSLIPEGPVSDALEYLETKIESGGLPNAYFIDYPPPTGSWLVSVTVGDAIDELSHIGAEHVVFTPSTGSALVSNNVGDALEELEGLIGTGGGGSSTLAGLTDVEITSPADEDDLYYDAGDSKWKNGHHSVRLAGDTMTGALTLAADPASSMQAATKQYVDGIATNLGKRGRVRLLDSSNSDPATSGYTNGATVDGVTVATGDLILRSSSSNQARNGVWVVAASGGASRSSEYDTYDEHPGSLIAVEEGTSADTIWLCTSNAGGTLNTTAITFNQATASGALLAANNLSDLSNAGTARTNLGLGTSATHPASDFLQASNNLSDLANAATARSNIGLSAGGIMVEIDGGGSTITTGMKGYLGPMPFAGTITQSTLLADQSGSIVVNIYKCTYSQFDAGSTHPVVGDKITASAPPTISSATKSQDSTLTGWTTSFSAGDIFAFNVDSVTSIQRAALMLKITK